MYRKLGFGLLALTLLLALCASAADGVIGQAISQGSMDVDHAQAAGIAPLSSGSTISTGEAPGRIVLRNGMRGALGPASQAEIYADRLVLRSGHATVTAGSGYRVQAGSYIIKPDPGARANIGLRAGQVNVGAASAPVAVTNQQGILLARVTPGSALSFEPAPAASSSHYTGTLTRKDVHFYLTDELTHIQVELVGNDLSAHVGKRVGVTGTATGTADHQIVQVTQTTRLATNGTTAAKAATGLSHGTKIGVAVMGGAVTAAGITLGAISR